MLLQCKGFEWDDGNSNKNWYLHNVSDSECEEVFFNQPLIVLLDASHSTKEVRHFALGRTEADRLLFVAFAIRNECVRVISARDMTRRETRRYAEEIKKHSDF